MTTPSNQKRRRLNDDGDVPVPVATPNLEGLIRSKDLFENNIIPCLDPVDLVRLAHVGKAARKTAARALNALEDAPMAGRTEVFRGFFLRHPRVAGDFRGAPFDVSVDRAADFAKRFAILRRDETCAAMAFFDEGGSFVDIIRLTSGTNAETFFWWIGEKLVGATEPTELWCHGHARVRELQREFYSQAGDWLAFRMTRRRPTPKTEIDEAERLLEEFEESASSLAGAEMAIEVGMFGHDCERVIKKFKEKLKLEG